MKDYRYITVTIVLFLLLGFGCKSAKTISSGETNLSLNAKQLIRENYKNQANFRTLASRVKINIVDGSKEQNYTVNLRIEKDKKILLSSTPISLVKALITPEKVSFYNKLDNTYFDGDFAYLSNLLGTDLNFEKVQNLLLGEAIYNLKDGNYNLSQSEDSYILQPKDLDELFEIFFLVNPSHFKLDSQQFQQLAESRFLQIDYLKYQEANKQTLPEHIKIIALEEADEVIIDLEYKSLSLNEDLRFPFKIPSGYDEITLK